ncbi:protein TolR [Sphingomonas sp. AR_OL41]|jgi:biopolymer transport protein TolR|uniref:protein TolR n=1 Tax=Sphingomonas sp. AR_OL41 TaxID=3042729 RepID=UPI0024805521|nr:protein TolR [Sphingomonas sp. AR_OL41]MDH7974325.1 protein TolR [Sphingomonas sp. AR_OL41]
MAINLPSQRGRGRRAPMADINVTPLVDVMLVLLIIFMVTAPLLTAGVPVELPDSKAKPLDQDQQPVEISLDRDGKIYVDKLAVSDSTLPDMLTQVAAKQQDGKPPQIFLRADRHLDYGKVMRVMGELNRAGLNRVALVTVGDDGK